VGPFRTESFNGKKFALHFTDSFTRFTTIYFVTHKSEYVEKLKQYLQFCKQCGVKVQMMKTYNAKEMTAAVCETVKQVLADHNCQHKEAGPYQHEENGIAERVWRTLQEMTLTMMMSWHLNYRFWVLATNHANYLRNRLPHKSIGFKTPYQLWFERLPDLSKVRMFGSRMFKFLPRESGRQKLAPAATEGIYVGHSTTSTTYLIFNYDTNKVSEWSDATITEVPSRADSARITDIDVSLKEALMQTVIDNRDAVTCAQICQTYTALQNRVHQAN
jgi:hypothetical protein